MLGLSHGTGGDMADVDEPTPARAPAPAPARKRNPAASRGGSAPLCICASAQILAPDQTAATRADEIERHAGVYWDAKVPEPGIEAVYVGGLVIVHDILAREVLARHGDDIAAEIRDVIGLCVHPRVNASTLLVAIVQPSATPTVGTLRIFDTAHDAVALVADIPITVLRPADGEKVLVVTADDTSAERLARNTRGLGGGDRLASTRIFSHVAGANLAVAVADAPTHITVYGCNLETRKALPPRMITVDGPVLALTRHYGAPETKRHIVLVARTAAALHFFSSPPDAADGRARTQWVRTLVLANLPGWTAEDTLAPDDPRLRSPRLVDYAFTGARSEKIRDIDALLAVATARGARLYSVALYTSTPSAALVATLVTAASAGSAAVTGVALHTAALPYMTGAAEPVPADMMGEMACVADTADGGALRLDLETALIAGAVKNGWSDGRGNYLPVYFVPGTSDPAPVYVIAPPPPGYPGSPLAAAAAEPGEPGESGESPESAEQESE